MELKICIKCKVPKSTTEFYVDNRLKDGHKGRCKLCCSEFLEREGVRERRLKQGSESIKRSKEKVTDNYVVRMLCHHTELTPDDIRKLPELIAIKKQIIITNRLIKDEKSKKRCTA